MTSLFASVGAVVVFAVLGYTLYSFLLGRKSEAPEAPSAVPDHLFVFVIPAHNEDRVIASSIERLLAMPGERHAVLVVDDGSSDETAAIVGGFDPRRVWLHRRHHPAAALGKGEALNDAYRQLLRRLEGRNLHRVIMCVLDADGIIDEHCLDVVEARFGDPELVALQLRVRISNRADSWLARLQDVEFCAFSDVYQLGRDSLGTPGLGGNGQFVRLGALSVLGDSPWTDSLTEDMAMGLELAAHGWKLGFCGDAAVHQQGLESLRPLLRQRTRWFQGQMQCLRLLGRIVHSALPVGAKVDLVFHLTNALLTLVAMVASIGWLARLGWAGLHGPSAAWGANLAGGRWLVLYLLAFPLAPVISVIYLRREPTVPLWRAIAAGHLYVLYSYLWLPAGIGALTRIVLGRRGWAKTERLTRQADGGVPQPGPRDAVPATPQFKPHPLPGWEQPWRPLAPSAAHRRRVIDLRSTPDTASTADEQAGPVNG